jgi:hypothetical protein
MSDIEEIEHKLLQIADETLNQWKVRLEKVDLILIRSSNIIKGGNLGKRDYFSEIYINVYKSDSNLEKDNPMFSFSVFLFYKGKPVATKELVTDINLWFETMMDDLQ